MQAVCLFVCLFSCLFVGCGWSVDWIVCLLVFVRSFVCVCVSAHMRQIWFQSYFDNVRIASLILSPLMVSMQRTRLTASELRYDSGTHVPCFP